MLQSPALTLEVENIERRATLFIGKNSDLSYKDRFINYWLEYLDLLFFYKYIYGVTDINLDNLVQFCRRRSRRGSSGLFLISKTANTSLFRNYFFIRITNLWIAILIALGSEVELVSFEKKLKSFYYSRLSLVFNQDDIRS